MHRCIAVCSIVGCCTCYAGMWVSPASKGGILRAISPAGRRFRASALHVVSGRKNHDVCVHTFLCIHVHLFLVFAFRDARFLSGLSHRFSYIVAVRGAQQVPAPGLLSMSNQPASRPLCIEHMMVGWLILLYSCGEAAYGSATSGLLHMPASFPLASMP